MMKPLFTNRCRMPLLILFAAILFCMPDKAKAQTTLATGDIAFTGYHSISGTGAGADTISFVLLQPISNNTRINFTDRGYTAGSWFATVGASEGSVSWISSSAIAAGTEVILVGLQAYTYNPTTGVRTANGTVTAIEGTFGTLGLALAGTGDQVIAYQSPGGAASVPQTAGNTMIAGIHYTTCNANTTAATWDGAGCTAGPNTSSMPPGLADGSSAMFIPTLPGNVTASCAKFNCTGTPAANAAAVKTAVYNISNWTRSATTIPMASNCLFLSSGPTITGHPANRTVCVNASTTFTVTVTNPGTYQWQEDNGGGFVDITPGAPFSGVNTATLTINPIGAGRNGYRYRCRATNGTSVNSNPAILTVDVVAGTSAVTPVSCNGGSNGTASVTVTSGILPIASYSWSPSGGTSATASGLAANTYTCTITDNIGCTGTVQAIITEPAQPVSATVTTVNNVTCPGGTNGNMTVTPSGGTPGYTYLWNTGGTTASIFGLTGGTYTVTVRDSKNCPTTASATVSAPPAFVTSSSSTQPSCNGGGNGTATVTVSSGGQPPYTYQWSPSAGSQSTATATGLTAGTYSVTVRDNNLCPTVVSGITVSQPTDFTVGTSQTNVSCNGGNNGTATVSVSGATSPYTYSWSPSGGTNATATGLAMGSYTVTITDNNTCQTTRSFNITQPAAALGGTISKTDVSCNGGGNGTATVSVTGGTTPYSYSWSPSGGTNATAIGLAMGTYTVTVTDFNGCQITRTTTVNQPAAALGGTISKTDVSCNGGNNGTTTVNVTGGTTPYSYSWSPSGGTNATATGLGMGTYTVTVTDFNGCQITRTTTVNQPAAALGGIITKTDVSCNGGNNGTATVNVSGGTTPYSYSWSPSGGTNATAIGLGMGTYTVTVTDFNGCQITRTTTVNQPAAALGGTISKTDVSCNGGNNGTATVSATGGTTPYSYSWSPSGGTNATAIGLGMGTYTVTVTDFNGCQITRTATVNQPAAALDGTISQTDVSCNGGNNGTATVSVTGGTTPYSYSWSPSGGTNATATGLAMGTYTVTVTDFNGCQITRSATVSQPAATVSGVTVVTNILCFGNSTGAIDLIPTGGIGPYTYDWGGGITSQDRSGLVAGTYTVTVTDANSCTGTVSATVNQPAAPLSGTTAVTNVSCFSGSNGAINLTPSGGTFPYTYDWGGGVTSEDRSGLTAGSYSVTITDDNACTATVSATVTEPAAALTVASTSQTDITCNGAATGSASVTVTGGTGAYTYSWSPSGGTAATASGLTAGTYTVTVTDANACQTTQSFTITEAPALVATAGTQVNVACNGGTTGLATVNVTGGTGAYTYSWSPSGGTGATASGLAPGTYTVTVTDANTCQTTQSFTITEPAAFAVSVSQTNVSCNGGSNGSAGVTVTGGTGAYTYTWTPNVSSTSSASGLSAGTYDVLVTDDNLCTVGHSFTITEPAVLAATTTQTNILCNGASTGSATVNVTGGTAPYSYSWSPGGATTASISALAAGTYTVTVTDFKGCITTTSATITQPAALQNTPSQTNILCNGAATGSATASVTGGTGAYTYSWSPTGGAGATASGLTAGTYTVTITDANLCQLTASYTLTEPSALVATAGTQVNVLCNGAATGSATVNVTGGTGAYTYSWSPSGGTAATASGLTAGTYTVTVKDANLCQTTQSFTITQPTALVATAGTQVNVSCNGGANGSATVNVTGGTGAYTYSWSPSGGTNATASGLGAGTYTVTVTDANLCQTTQTFTITQPNALVATAGTQVNVSCNGGANGSATVNVTGGTGAYTYSWSPTGGTNATASGLGAGTYTVTVTDANTCQTTQSFTITQPPVLVATAGTQVNVLCNGAATGSATVNVTGGTGAYTYSWSPSGGTGATASGLTAGTYTVTVKDVNLCQTTQSFTITQPTALVATAGTQVNVLCNGAATGSATVNVTGGTGAYTYSWSPSGGTGATASGLTAGTYTVTVKDANLCQTTQSFTITQPTALVATAGTQVNVSCFAGSNGSATVNVTGGTGAYTYSWSPTGGTGATASGLAFGTYTVTVKDANLCQTTQSFTITQPTALVATAGTQVNVLCNGAATGSATVNVTGGTGAYTYSWSPSGGTGATASGLTAGTYTVTVKDVNLCQTTQSFTITQPTALVATAGTQVNVLCNGAATGSATVNVTGGTGAYTYSWSPSGGTGATASGLTAGTYTVTVKDANLCQTTQSFTITQPTALVATAGTQVNVSCNGGANGSATVNVTGGTGAYTYSWSPTGGTGATASGLAFGTYTVTVKDANLCQTTQSFTITEPTQLVATAGAQTNVSCFAGSNGSATVNVTGGTGAYTYSWSPSGGTGATASGLTAGTYTVTVKDANLCQTTQSFTITGATAVNLVPSQTNLLCYEAANGTASVAVTGGTGAYTYTWSPAVSNTASASGLDAGSYTVTVKDANLCTATHTFVITQPTELLASSTQVNVTCFGGNNGSIAVTATGGTGAYTYDWVPGSGSSSTLSNLTAGTYTYMVTDDNDCQFLGIATITQPAQLQATVAPTNVSCNGAANGGATLTVTGGTGAYTYSWSPGSSTTASISNVGPGTYTYTVTDDNDCELTGSIIITQPAVLALTGSSTNVTCNGANDGSAEVTVAGGTTPYTYSWTPGGAATSSIDDLAPGTYTVTVTDANDCEATYTATITQPTVLAVTASHTNVACNGGTTGDATLVVAGGTVPYTYAWTPGGETDSTLDNLEAGTYGYTVTDGNGCEVTGSITVTEATAIVTSTVHENVFCNGDNTGTAAVIVTGGVTPYEYVWTPGNATDSSVTGLEAGAYTVIVTDDNGCTATANVTITEPNAIASTQTLSICGGESVTVGGNTYTVSGTYTDVLTAQNGCDSTITTVLTVNVVNVQTSTSFDYVITAAATDASYQWINCNTNTLIAGATAQTFAVTENGSYAVQVTKNGCSDTSACVTIANIGIVENNATNFEISLYPNPTSDYVYIQTNASIRSVEVLDLSGKKLQPTYSVNKLDFSTLPGGVYLVRVTAVDGRMAVLRVVRM